MLGAITTLASETKEDLKPSEKNKTKFELHGNWVPQYKMEYFINEGTLKNTRPVNELVFGEGSINIKDSGFYISYFLKKVWFENNITKDLSDKNNPKRHIKQKFSSMEMELDPGYQKNIGKHSFNTQLITLWKSGSQETYDKASSNPNNPTSTYGIRTLGYGLKEGYKYQITDNLWFNTEIKGLNETKSGPYYSKNGFMSIESVSNLGYRVNVSFTMGLEGFAKRGYEYTDGGYKHQYTNVAENQIRPWVSITNGKNNLLLKMEIGEEKQRGVDKNNYRYDSDDIKFIISDSYQVKPGLYLTGETTYRKRSNKKINRTNYGNTNVYFAKVGLNYNF